MKKISKSLFISGAMIAALILSGCGPIYSTSYTYVPPKSSSGMSCISMCEVTRTSCEQSEGRRRDDCEYRSRRDYDWCKTHGDKNCYREFCRYDISSCKENYNSCYQACGGKVETQSTCTAFCNK